MQRNLDKRIEVSAPILDTAIQNEVKDIFDMQWKDNVKARLIDPELKNRYVKKANPDDEDWNAQIEIYKYYQRKLMAENEVNQ